MLKVIAFDCGGVILSNAWNDPIFKVVTARLGISKTEGDGVFYKHWPEIRVGQKSENVVFQDLLDNARRKISLSELKELYYDCVHKKDAFEVIEKLHRDYPELLLYTLNDEGKEWMDLRIRKFELRKYFQDFITSGYLGFGKPDRRIYEVLLERAKVKAKECLFIDDSESLLIPARELGFQAILFKEKQQLERELRGYSIKL